MINNFNNSGRMPISENSLVVKIIRKFEQFEFYALSLLILIILLFTLNISGLDLVTTAVMSALASLYFFTAFAPGPELPNAEKALFIQKMAGIGPAVALMGIMFAMLNWPGSNRLLIAGGLACLFCLFYSFAIKTEEKQFNVRLTKIRIRCVSLVIVCAVYGFASTEKLIEFGFKRVNSKDSSVAVQDTLNNSPQR